jgi:hypothetical protein
MCRAHVSLSDFRYEICQWTWDMYCRMWCKPSHKPLFPYPSRLVLLSLNRQTNAYSVSNLSTNNSFVLTFVSNSIFEVWAAKSCLSRLACEIDEVKTWVRCWHLAVDKCGSRDRSMSPFSSQYEYSYLALVLPPMNHVLPQLLVIGIVYQDAEPRELNDIRCSQGIK